MFLVKRNVTTQVFVSYDTHAENVIVHVITDQSRVAVACDWFDARHDKLQMCKHDWRESTTKGTHQRNKAHICANGMRPGAMIARLLEAPP
jgi:hypothetical protein